MVSAALLEFGVNVSMMASGDKLSFLGVKGKPGVALTEHLPWSGRSNCCPLILQSTGKFQPTGYNK